MGKKKNKKQTNIGSNSLLPARHDGDKPDIPFTIKTEPSDYLNITEEAIFSLVEASKNAVLPADAEASNHSDISTATEPMDTGEGTLNDSGAEDFSENQVVPISIDNVIMKEEPIESEVAGNQESRLENFMPYNQKDNCLRNGVFIPVVNDQVKEEQTEINKVCLDINDHEMTNTTVNIKAEPIENNQKLDENCKEIVPTKRKLQLEEKLEAIRKKLKIEPIETVQNASILVNENQMAKKNYDSESSNDTETEEIIDNDIAVLSVPIVQKNIDVVTISDGEDDEQNSESQKVSMINSPKKTVKEKKFSTDILKYFNVISELDRHDCHTCLDYLSKYKTNNVLQKFFPIIKKEGTSKDKTQKGDILFKREVTETDSDIKRASISPNIDSNLLNKLPVHPAAKAASQHVECPVPYAAASQYVNAPIQPATTSENFNFPVPSISESSMILPNIPVLSNFGVNQIAASQSASNSSIGKSDHTLSIPNLQRILEQFNLHQNSQIYFPHKNMLIEVPSQNMPLEDPCQNTPSQECQNSLMNDVHQNFQLHDPRLRKKSCLENGSTNQIVNSTLIPSQTVAPLPNQDYQRFPGSSTSHPSRDSSVSSTLFPGNRVVFSERKGAKSLLYQNIGREDINPHFETLILQWNPSWLETQKLTGCWPPICKFYPTVVYFYKNEMDYYTTYVPLHMLHLWYTIYQCWERKPPTVIEGCKVQSVEKLEIGFRISCSIELEDKQVWPKRDDILLCKHNGKEAFLSVTDVKKRPISLLKISKLKISLQSLDHLDLKLDDEISFCILYNIRTASLQTDALNSLDNSMKELVLKPESHLSCIGIVKLDGNKHIKEQRGSVFQVLLLENIRVIVIETYQMCNSVSLITQLAFNIAYNASKYKLIHKNEANKQFKVLIILKNDDLFHKLHRSLCTYDPVLAVRTKQINLAPDLLRHTLEERLEKKENLSDILNNHHIFMTTFSAFGQAEKLHLSKLKHLICIVDDANLCTEVETALPLTLKIKKLLLIGSRHQCPYLPDVLRNQNFHISLFVRLLKAMHEL